jgi:hypothetical protein
MSTKFYFIFHKATGDLRSLASVDPTNTVSDFESCVEVTNEYLELSLDCLSIPTRHSHASPDGGRFPRDPHRLAADGYDCRGGLRSRR